MAAPPPVAPQQPFDWPDFLTLADELSRRPEEACLRTSISRAYYYIYHLGRQRVLDNGFIVNHYGDSHRQVWEKFENDPTPDCKKLAILANQLKDKRQRADYDKPYVRIADEFPAVIEIARKFATDLARLNARLPVNRGVHA